MAGVYDVVVAYFDEADGASWMQIVVDGATVDEWSWDGATGSVYANASTKRYRSVSSVVLSPGDRVELKGRSQGAEPLRTDFIELVPSN